MLCLVAAAQFDMIRNHILKIDSFNTSFPREKIFLHTNKPYYFLNDTLWTKGYVISASDNYISDSSKIAYIEIYDADAILVKRISTSSSFGMFYSAIWLKDPLFKQGQYLIRAYSSYMRNAGDSLFYEKIFSIIDPDSNEWKLPVNKLDFTNENNVNQTKDPEGSAPGKNRIQPSVAGNGETLTDLRFFAEGGRFIAGKLQQVGFKATDIYGKGVPITGRIENSKKQTVTIFTTVHNGMGTIWLTPIIDEVYTAVLQNGKNYQLPLPTSKGTMLQVVNNPTSDSIEISVDATPDLLGQQYFFRASAKGISCAMGLIRPGPQPYKRSFSKKAFPSGICRFTLYDKDGLPVNERATLVWHREALTLQLTAEQKNPEGGDSISVSLSAKDSKNKYAVAGFSAIVLDTSNVTYNKHEENLISYLLLQSDINGKIESPFYYFDNPLPQAIDALMLTHGWVQYDHFYEERKYKYDAAFTVSGRLLNIANRPVSEADVLLFGKEGRLKSFVLNTSTDKNGRFIFSGFPNFSTDSVTVLIRALNRKGKAYGIGLALDQQHFPAAPLPFKNSYPSALFIDTTEENYIKKQVEIKKEQKIKKGFLPEIILTSKAKVAGSKNLNTDGAYDELISQKTLEAVPEKTLREILTGKIKGFHKGPLPKSMLQAYKRSGDLVVFIIDGYNLLQLYEPTSDSKTAFTEFEESWLDYIKAGDIKGIEVMYAGKNSIAYEQYFNLYSTYLLGYTFIEITTYSGNGAFNKNIPGMHLHKPLVPIVLKSYYQDSSPAIENKTDTLDNGAGSFWIPDIITNEKGESRLSFPAPRRAAKLLFVVQGTDGKGGLGVGVFPLEFIEGRWQKPAK